MILAVTMNPSVDKIYFVDDFKLGSVRRCSSFITSAGGKGLNVARVAKQIGEEVVVTGFLGGSNGQFIRTEIKKLGLIDRFVEIDGETRNCINITDKQNGRTSEVLELGPTITPEQSEKFINSFDKMIQDIDIVTLCGSLPKGLDADFYSKLIDICNQQGKQVLLDTSGEAFKLGAKSKPYMVKPNEDEIHTVYDGDVSTEKGIIEALKFFKESGVEFPVVSLGKEGSLAAYGDDILKVTFPSVKTVNTVGSGDSFIAGFAAGLSRKYSVEDVMKLATACGSANTQYEQTGYVECKTVDDFFGKVGVETI